MGLLEVSDIQGNILRGYGFPAAAYLFFEIKEADGGRSFLRDLADRLEDAAPWQPPGPATTTNVAITHPGLVALGVSRRILDALPAAFREPMRERAGRLLDDRGVNAAGAVGRAHRHRAVASPGVDQRPRRGSARRSRPRSAAVLGDAGSHGLELVHRQDAGALPKRREHFGWADGFSQPAIAGAPWTEVPGNGVPEKGGTWRSLNAGEFVHGYPDEDGQTSSGPAAELLRNGTYMVYRKLYQDVVAFRAQLHDDALAYGRSLPADPPLDPDQLYELMAAKVVGRWRDGEPIELTPRREESRSRALGDEAEREPSNDFRYLPDDEGGRTCPVGAHIRRTNPRDALGWEGQISRRHRIIRRGMPYGPFLEFHEGQSDDGEDRGLVFVCFNASLDRQFEVIQRQWCNDGNAFGLGNDKDYLLGDVGVGADPPDPAPLPDGRLSSGRVVIQGTPPHLVRTRPPVVRTRGSEYLLMPGIGAVRGLASGRWMERGAPAGAGR